MQLLARRSQMWSVEQMVLGLVILGVVIGLALLAGPFRSGVEDNRGQNRRGTTASPDDHDGPSPPQVPGPFFRGG
jgi:hypothetical protein